jgi:hypothetical protein
MVYSYTPNKVKIIFKIPLNKINRRTHDNLFTVFELEPRTDKNNAILLHGDTKIINDIINDYNIKINKIYEQNAN